MKHSEFLKEQNEQIKERYELVMERIALILTEDTVKGATKQYFNQVASFLLQMKEVAELVLEDRLRKLPIEKLQAINAKLYEDICEKQYVTSFANPVYAVKELGAESGKLLCYLYDEIRGLIAPAFEGRLFEVTILAELFVEIYNYYEEEDAYTPKDVRQAIYYYNFDYMDVLLEYRMREMFDPSFSFANDIIEKEDLTDLRYLYYYGEFVSENEIKTANFLNSLSEQQIKDMAVTYVGGLQRGFEEARLDISKKKTVAVRYRLGFERMVLEIIRQFREIGIEVILYRTASNSLTKRAGVKVGYHGTSANRQYDYDHRFDHALYFDKGLVTRRLACERQAHEAVKEFFPGFAGPSAIEVFGEKRFEPVNHAEAISLDEKQRKLTTELNRDKGLLANEYIKSDEISFVLIAYPIPEIGDQFEEIFAETVMVNTLDNEKYKKIQQAIIDALDTADSVHVVGAGKNKTDLTVNLWKLQNPEKETIFENCTASVNIPVGEVFTSPKLTGTNGKLHVTQVYLHDYEYSNLELDFVDGKITTYTCTNFDSEEENKKFVRENLMYNHETLPIGEFAIGTNTTAYTMARKYNISDKLPILIAEKTGPHFAVGDTCYKMSEDHKVYNPDGKEIVARDNEVSILRKTDMEHAYYNCHTDITIPYNELKEISLIRKDGSKEAIIINGRFVLPGTEELNQALED